MFLDLLKYKKRPFEWDMKNIILVGPQNSGKTVLIRYLVYLIQSNPDYKGFVSVLRTNDLRIIGDKRYSEYFEGFKVLVIIIDDVIREGFDSRRSMSGANVDTTQQFCITRHILEQNYGPNGLIFMIFASQVFHRIDATIRNTAQLQIFTSYFDQPWFHSLFSPQDAEVLRIATYEGMFASNFDARRFAIAKTLTGDVATIEVPFSKKSDVPYPYIDRTVDKDLIINQLTQILLTKLDDITKFTKGELKGFLGLEAKKIEQDYCVRLTKSDFTTAIDKAFFFLKLKQLKKTDKANENYENEKTPNGRMIENNILIYHDTLGLSFMKIAEKLRIPKSTAFDIYQRQKRSFENWIELNKTVESED